MRRRLRTSADGSTFAALPRVKKGARGETRGDPLQPPVPERGRVGRLVTDPEELAALLEHSVDEFVKNYRIAHDLGYGQRRNGGQRVSGGDKSDPTYGAIVAHEAVRAKVRSAAGHAKEAIKKLERGQVALDKAFDRADGEPDLPVRAGVEQNQQAS